MARGVTDRWTPEGARFFGELRKLAALEVRVGFTAGGAGRGANGEPVSAEECGSGATVAEIAAFNEFGTEHIPARPFMRQSAENNKDAISAMCRIQMEALARGETDADGALRALGALQVGLVQHEMTEGGFAENAESTKKRKDSSMPLIDTGRMRQSVHYVVGAREG